MDVGKATYTEFPTENGGSILLVREHKRICSVCLLDVLPPVLEEAVVVVGVALSIGLFDSMDAGGGASF